MRTLAERLVSDELWAIVGPLRPRPSPCAEPQATHHSRALR
jgi:hypothetical protein